MDVADIDELLPAAEQVSEVMVKVKNLLTFDRKVCPT